LTATARRFRFVAQRAHALLDELGNPILLIVPFCKRALLLAGQVPLTLRDLVMVTPIAVAMASVPAGDVAAGVKSAAARSGRRHGDGVALGDALVVETRVDGANDAERLGGDLLGRAEQRRRKGSEGIGHRKMTPVALNAR
jgi:hypothetical protein